MALVEFRVGRFVGSLAVLCVLLLSACGSSVKKHAATTASTASTPVPTVTTGARRVKHLVARRLPPGETSAPAKGTRAAKLLHVVLAAVAPPSGSGRATIRIYARQRKVCWTFSDLVGVSRPSSAAIGIGNPGSGAVEFLLAARYHSSGCTRPRITQGALASIAKVPGDFFVEIFTSHGRTSTLRLRGQLAPGGYNPTLPSASPAAAKKAAAAANAAMAAQSATEPSFTGDPGGASMQYQLPVAGAVPVGHTVNDVVFVWGDGTTSAGSATGPAGTARVWTFSAVHAYRHATWTTRSRSSIATLRPEPSTRSRISTAPTRTEPGANERVRRPADGVVMRARPLAAGARLALLTVALTGCGSGLTAHPATPTTPSITTAATTPSTATTPTTASKPTTTRQVASAPTQTAPVRQGTTFHVALSGAAPSRHSRPPSGSATIQVLTKLGEVCWTFTKVTGVAHPGGAYIGDVAGADYPSSMVPTAPVFLFGPRYAARGCIKLIASAIGEILSAPTGDYDIGIATGKHLNVIWGVL
jgi:hypothetical protein